MFGEEPRTEVDMSETAVCSAPGLLKARESLTGARQNKLAAHGVESLKMEGKHHLDLSTRAATEEPRSGVDMSETAVYSAPALLKAHESLSKAHQNKLAANPD